METDVSSHQALAPPTSQSSVELQIVALVFVLVEEDEEDAEPDDGRQNPQILASFHRPDDQAEMPGQSAEEPGGDPSPRDEEGQREEGTNRCGEELGSIQRVHVCSMWPDSVGALERPFKDLQRACTDYFSKLRKLAKIAHFLPIVNHTFYENYLSQHLWRAIP